MCHKRDRRRVRVFSSFIALLYANGALLRCAFGLRLHAIKFELWQINLFRFHIGNSAEMQHVQSP